ncbi:uncharacterized protein LOC126325483 [Schistocerca gregaria]|uniref:uncharacterized protein LOC126325483 n=1 Tax=Schistocerca gregaria TaxID=7010 RepID=UPI00211E2E04|nr:uncharacterized protein LOC126325483 [Schistocerca gregaria]
MVSESLALPSIITLNQDLDRILNGGVQLGRITEFCGMPGIGKTQMGIQLAINTFIPDEYGGCAGCAIYIDTEGSFMVERAVEMATSLVNYIESLINDQKVLNVVPKKLTLSYILQNLHYYRVYDYIELIALIGQLADIVKELNANRDDGRGLIRCIVIDSITFHFRACDQFKDMAQRARLLSTVASQLTVVANSFNVAIVLVNQMTTKPGFGIVPALGETWSHHASTRILLEKAPNSNMKRALILKSPDLAPSYALYQVTPDGIR